MPFKSSTTVFYNNSILIHKLTAPHASHIIKEGILISMVIRRKWNDFIFNM